MPVKFHVLSSFIGLLVITALIFGSNGRLVIAVPAFVLAVVCGIILFRWRRAAYPSSDARDEGPQ
ncbi:hypothetical protein [Clavibacter sp. Sh2088]|uniref:hypothetical protein n=1 Tax=Clavibacter sp. Sh2088 TaxID=3397676 RepID=UPI0039E17180